MNAIHEVTDAAAFSALEQEWNDLHEASPSDSVFSSYDWLHAWWTHFGESRRLFVLCLRRDGQLSAVLPLVISKQPRAGAPLRTAQLLGGGWSDYLGMLATADPGPAADAFARHLRSRSAMWDRLELNDLRDDDGTRCLARSLREFGLCGAINDGHASPYLRVAGSWDDFYATRFSAKTRRGHRSKRRRIENHGDLRVRIVRDLACHPDALEKTFGMNERDAIHGTARRRPFDDERGRAFFRDVCERFSTRGWLNLAMMELDEELIAYRLSFTWKNRHFDYFHGFAQEHSRHSPGLMLVIDVLRDCFESGIEEIDLLRGEEDWKAMWADDARVNTDLVGDSPALRSRLQRRLHFPSAFLGR